MVSISSQQQLVLLVLLLAWTPLRAQADGVAAATMAEECVVSDDGTQQCARPQQKNEPALSLSSRLDDALADSASFLWDAIFGSTEPQPETEESLLSSQQSGEQADPFAALHDGQPQKDPGFRQQEGRWDTIVALLRSSASDASSQLLQELLYLQSEAATKEKESYKAMMDVLISTAFKVREQLDRTFGDVVALSNFDLLQTWYYMIHEESVKDAVWKRRVHRYMRPLPVQEAVALADGLYLSDMAYLASCDHIHAGLKKFHDNSWALLNCTTTGKPSAPAHFLAVKRLASTTTTRGSSSGTEASQPWEWIWKQQEQQKEEESTLEVALVIRGTKELADILSDALLEATEYQTGKAHYGMMQSATWLHDSYREFLSDLLAVSGQAKLKLSIVGHSLGGGAASLASVEFNKHADNIEAYAIGFGTPAVVSADLSADLAGTVTTVVNDADCVPRMSGALLANAWVRMTSYNWTAPALQDVGQLKGLLKQVLPKFGGGGDDNDSEAQPGLDQILNKLDTWVHTFLKTQVEPNLKARTGGPFTMQELYPPGDCIHLYRDGTSWQCVHIPCSEFNEIEFVRHALDDHLIDKGYYPGLLGYIRNYFGDLNWRFSPDLLELAGRE